MGMIRTEPQRRLLLTLLLQEVLLNICRRGGLPGVQGMQEVQEERKVSYLAALVSLLQVLGCTVLYCI